MNALRIVRTIPPEPAARPIKDHPLRPCWEGMLGRCSGEHNKDYGGRGIRVCKRWRASFAAFVADMGPKPSPEYTIERIDVNGNYEPGNCRWATIAEQARNTRRHPAPPYSPMPVLQPIAPGLAAIIRGMIRKFGDAETIRMLGLDWATVAAAAGGMGVRLHVEQHIAERIEKRRSILAPLAKEDF